MKFWQTLVLTLVIFGGLSCTILLWRHTSPHDSHFEFKHVGEEGWSNQFNVYRFNKDTGEIMRFALFRYNADKATGRPNSEQIIATNLLNGKSYLYDVDAHSVAVEAWRASQAP